MKYSVTHYYSRKMYSAVCVLFVIGKRTAHSVQLIA
jgi:hypothetical protein